MDKTHGCAARGAKSRSITSKQSKAAARIRLIPNSDEEALPDHAPSGLSPGFNLIVCFCH